MSTITLTVVDAPSAGESPIKSWTLHEGPRVLAGGYTNSEADACANAAAVLDPNVNYRMNETIADLAWMLGSYLAANSGEQLPEDSREKVRMVVAWAAEFEAKNALRDWDAQDADYLAEIENFFQEKIENP